MAKSKYKDNFPLLAEGWLRDGATDKTVCKNLGISQETFYQYVKRYPEFAEAIKRGKSPVDRKVENALLKRAMGYEYEEIHKEIKDSNGNKYQVVKKIVKQMAPDVTAQIFWLKNRKPDKFRDKHEINHSGKIDNSLTSKLAELPVEELRKIVYGS